MEDKKLIAQALLEVAKNSITELIEDAKIDKELVDAAKKIGLILPSPDLAVFKTTYCEIDKVNKNGVILSRKAVKEGLNTLVGKQLNWEHSGAGFVCGYTIKAEINEDKVETINVLFKSLFPEKFEELKEKIKTKEAAVSFEIWNKNPDNGKSVVKQLDNGYLEVNPIIFHGTGVLLVNQPACPSAKIFKLIANKLTEAADKVMNNVFAPDLIYAGLAVEIPKCKNCGNCNCGKEVKVIVKQIESKEWICPHCEKTIGEKELFCDENQKWYHRPCIDKGEIILPKDNNEKGGKELIMLEELFSKVTKEEEVTFEIAMAFYYASEDEQAKITEDAAKWTKKFINNLPDSAFAVIEPAYPEKTEDKNARHLPHHNGEGDLGKDKSNENLDLPHYKNALARVNQIKPISDSISAEDLQKKAGAHLERHKDALEKASDETKTEGQSIETKPVEGAETKIEEPKVDETKEATQAQEMQVIEPKITVKVTRIYSDIYVDTYAADGTMSGTSEGKSTMKTITEYTDGTQDIVEGESEYKRKYTFAELEAKVAEAKAEKDAEIATLKADAEKVKQDKDTEITSLKAEVEKEKNEKISKDTEIANLKTELGTKTQELDTIKAKDNRTDDLNVGVVDVKDKSNEVAEGIDEKAYGKKSK